MNATKVIEADLLEIGRKDFILEMEVSGDHDPRDQYSLKLFITGKASGNKRMVFLEDMFRELPLYDSRITRDHIKAIYTLLAWRIIKHVSVSRNTEAVPMFGNTTMVTSMEYYLRLDAVNLVSQKGLLSEEALKEVDKCLRTLGSPILEDLVKKVFSSNRVKFEGRNIILGWCGTTFCPNMIDFEKLGV